MTVIPIPVAVDDTATTPQAAPVTIGVTGNDNLGAAPTSVTSHTNAAHGSVTCTASNCTYTPNAGFSGSDSFDYTITDSNSRTSAATVTITVTPPSSSPPPTSPAPPASAPGSPASPADLATTVTGPRSTQPGRTVSLAAVVRNNGSGSPAEMQVTLTVPAGFVPRPGTIAVDGAPAGSACVVVGAVITCRLGTLAPGAAVRITWQAAVRPDTPDGAHLVRSNVVSSTTDPVPVNNPSSWVIHTKRPAPKIVAPKLTLVTTVDRKRVRPGGKVRGTIVVRNRGSGMAEDVLVCMPAPAHAAFVRAPGAAFRDGRACWTIKRLGPGASRRFHVVLRVDATAARGLLRSVAFATRRGGGRPLSSRATVAVLAGRPPVRPGGVTG